MPKASSVLQCTQKRQGIGGAALADRACKHWFLDRKCGKTKQRMGAKRWAKYLAKYLAMYLAIYLDPA